MNPAFNQNSNGVSVVGVAGPALVAEPPLSPPPPHASVPQPAPAEPAPVLEVAPAPAPVAPAPEPAPPAPAEPEAPAGLPLEGLLLRFGLITTEQLTEAMRERAATGKDIGAIVVEHGWVDAAQLARVASYGQAFETEPPAEPAPEPVPVAEPEVEPAPSPAPSTASPAPAAASGQRVKVFVRLTSGERLDAGTFDGLDGAKERGAEFARALAAEAPEWPFVAGRFLRPDTIVSLDVEPELSA